MPEPPDPFEESSDGEIRHRERIGEFTRLMKDLARLNAKRRGSTTVDCTDVDRAYFGLAVDRHKSATRETLGAVGVMAGSGVAGAHHDSLIYMTVGAVLVGFAFAYQYNFVPDGAISKAYSTVRGWSQRKA